MDANAWERLADTLLRDGSDEASAEEEENYETQGKSSIDGIDAGEEGHADAQGMDAADWENLLDELVTEDRSDVDPMHVEPDGLPVPKKQARPKLGRPLGTFGSHALRKSLKEAEVSDTAPPDVGEQSVPGSAAFARAAKKRKAQALVAASSQLCKETGNTAASLPGMGSSAWVVMKALPLSHVQQALVSTAAAACSLPKDETSIANEEKIDKFLTHALFEVERSVKTHSQMAEDCSIAPDRVAPLLKAGAAAAVETARVLWSTMFAAAEKKMKHEGWHGIMLCHRCKYDETPTLTRLRAQALDKQLPDSSEASSHGKVVQAQGSFHMLFANKDKTEFFEIGGSMPNLLQVVESTTAECLKQVRLNVLGLETIPELNRISQHFQWCLQQATIDRYAGNLKAERALLHDQLLSLVGSDTKMRASKLSVPCDVHRIHQSFTASLSLANPDVTGLLSTSLTQQGAGVMQSLRETLATILEQRLVIYYEDPPQGAAARRRESVYELYLPGATSQGEEFHDVRAGRLQRKKRRFILENTLNGFLDSNEVAHYCAFGCCDSREATMEKIRRHTVWALLPGKLPRFSKNRWQGHFGALSYCGLLAAHHNLLTPLLLAWTGAPVPASLEEQAKGEPDNAAFIQALADAFSDDDDGSPRDGAAEDGFS